MQKIKTFLLHLDYSKQNAGLLKNKEYDIC